MKVAIATQDQVRVDGHFARARHLMIFDVQPEGSRHLRNHSFADVGQRKEAGHRLAARVRAVRGCSLVFVAAIGPEGERALSAIRALPIRRFAGHSTAATLDALRDTLRTTTTPWLRRHLMRRDI